MSAAPKREVAANVSGPTDPPRRGRASEGRPRPRGARAPAHRAIGKLVLVVFWLLMLEGVLRKWVAPEYAQYIFFIRDPFVLLIYWHALRANAFRQGGVLLRVGAGFAAIAIALAFVQSVTFDNPKMFLVSLYGWRQYFLYLPLPFVLASTLNHASLRRFAKHLVVAVTLNAVLALAQSASPPASVLNRGIAEDAALQFESYDFTGGKIRPSGTFTTNIGVTHLVPSTLAVLLALWLTPAKRRRLALPWLVIGTAATAACLAVSGSRGAFVHVLLVGTSALLVGFVTRNGAVRVRALALPIALFVAGAILYPIVFPEALSLMMQRLEQSVGGGDVAGGIVDRILADGLNFVNFLADTPVLGYGLGLGGNGRTYLGVTDVQFLSRISAEADWSRHIVDLGTVFGILFILYRIAFTAATFFRALRATRASSDPMPLLLFGYVGIVLFYGLVTGNGTVGGFAWLFLGLCMASCRLALGRKP